MLTHSPPVLSEKKNRARAPAPAGLAIGLDDTQPGTRKVGHGPGSVIGRVQQGIGAESFDKSKILERLWLHK